MFSYLSHADGEERYFVYCCAMKNENISSNVRFAPPICVTEVCVLPSDIKDVPLVVTDPIYTLRLLGLFRVLMNCRIS